MAVRRRRRVHRARGRDARPVRGDRGRTCARCATSPTSSPTGSGVVVHEVVADGSIWYGKDLRELDPATNTVKYFFNTDEIVKFPAAVALIWRWTGDDRFRDEMLDFTRRNLEYVRTRLDEDEDGWPEGNGNVERPGHGRGEARQRRLLHPRAVRLRRHGPVGGADGGRRRGRGARRRPARRASRTPGGWRPRAPTPTRSTTRATSRQPEALDRRRPDGGRALRRRRVRARPRLVRARHGGARDAREQLLQRRAARQPRPVPHGLRRRADRRGRVRASSRSAPA